jgi:twitching motility protein PilI
MARRTNLRQFQEQVAARIAAASARSHSGSRLAVEAGGHWLIPLAEAGEVLPVGELTPVPLTRAWFRGMVSVRGMLYAVSDLSAFAGGPPVVLTSHAKLLLIGQPRGGNAALLVSRVLGLRHIAEFDPVDGEAASGSWRGALLRDTGGATWRVLDPGALLRSVEFLQIAA